MAFFGFAVSLLLLLCRLYRFLIAHISLIERIVFIVASVSHHRLELGIELRFGIDEIDQFGMELFTDQVALFFCIEIFQQSGVGGDGRKYLTFLKRILTMLVARKDVEQ